MESNQSNNSEIFKDLKKMYYRASFYERYGGSVFACIFIIIFVLIMTTYYFVITESAEIRDDWANQRCSPRILPFAGMINTPPGKSSFEFTAENFNHCLNGIVEGSAINATAPLTWLISTATNTLKMLGDSINVIRAYITRLRVMVMSILSEIYHKISSILIPIQKMLIQFIDTLNKMNGVFKVTLGMAEGSYNILASSIGALHEFIVIILLILSALIVVLWSVPVTWGFAAAMTTIFLAILIPLSIIAIFMHIIFDIQGSGIPGVPSCFDENTIIKTANNKSVKIKDIEVGTELLNGSFVTAKMKMSAYKHDMFNLNNILVSGNHRVIFKNKLIMVKDHPGALQIKYSKPFIYCLNTSNKHIELNNCVFTDYDDLDKKEFTKLKYLLSDSNLSCDKFHNYYEGGMDKNTKIKLYNGEVKNICDLSVYDKLENKEIVLGLVEVDAENIDIYRYHLHNLEIIAGKNLSFYDSNLGIIRTMSNGLLKEKVENSNIDKLYSIVTNTKYFTINNYKFYDYNGVLDVFFEKEHANIIKNII